MRDDGALVLTGSSAAGALRLDLAAPDTVDAYLPEGRVDAVVEGYGLEPAPVSEANVILRAVPDEAWGLASRRVIIDRIGPYICDLTRDPSREWKDSLPCRSTKVVLGLPVGDRAGAPLDSQLRGGDADRRRVRVREDRAVRPLPARPHRDDRFRVQRLMARAMRLTTERGTARRMGRGMRRSL